ncbi:MAG: hypothetical protein RLO51_26255 [Thalassobaculum sp.]|uniref:hypothetical protein n=1 Tax=Thalassobaculum sp. TaxID=2022740 RepID=UPI0032EBE5B6
MPSFLGHPRVNTVLLPAPVYATWNPAGTNPNITLSDWNLTAQVTGPNTANAYTLSASGGGNFDDGKRYFEVRTVSLGGAAGSISIGFADSDLDPGGAELGDLPWGYAWRGDGVKKSNGIANSLGVVLVPGSIIMIAISSYVYLGQATAKIWFGENGVWFDGGNPSVNENPAFDGAIASSATDWGVRASLKTNGDRIMANFGGSPFMYNPPSGFSAGWGLGV